MAYVDRNGSNEITSVYSRQQSDNQEYLEDSDSEILSFISPAETYIQKRQKNIADGGYGSWQEQLEMLNEQGLVDWQAHCAQIKLDHPKP